MRSWLTGLVEVPRWVLLFPIPYMVLGAIQILEWMS